MPIQKICPICSKTFEVRPGLETIRKCCSLPCRNIWLKQIPHTTEWRTNQSKSLKGRKITWADKISKAMVGKPHSVESRASRSEFTKGDKNPFYGKEHKLETRKQISASHQRITLDEWEDFTKPLYIQIRNSQKYMNWVKAVFEKDNYCDYFSGERGNGNLNAHHIIHFSTLIDKYKIKTYEDAMACHALWDVDNGVTMIDINHIAYHSQKKKVSPGKQNKKRVN